jgi:prophage DNA circulation protein
MNDPLKDVLDFHNTEVSKAWRRLLQAKVDSLKDQILTAENKGEIAAQALAFKRLLDETAPTERAVAPRFKNAAF